MGDLQTIFQSTLSVRRATGAGTLAAYQVTLFQSTLSVRRATAGFPVHPSAQQISIHALREESDEIDFGHPCPPLISIHALREESDAQQTVLRRRFHGFQSTLSVRRATLRFRGDDLIRKFQSTLSVRRAT